MKRRSPTQDTSGSSAQARASSAPALREEVERNADPARAYLRELGIVPLLDRDGEVAIAKRIEQGEAQIYQALAARPVALQELLALLELGRPHSAGHAIVTDEVLGSFRKIAERGRGIEEAKAKLRTLRDRKRTSLEKSIDRKVADVARLIKEIRFTVVDLDR